MKPTEVMKLDNKINEVCRLKPASLGFLGMRGEVNGASSHSYKVQRAKPAI
jgi:hypothetical protein